MLDANVQDVDKKNQTNKQTQTSKGNKTKQKQVDKQQIKQYSLF